MEIAICQCAYAQLRAEPTHKSELVSQLKYGEPVRILSQSGDWAKIQTEHAYEGHVRLPQLQIMTNFSPKNLHLSNLEISQEKGLPYSAGSFVWEDFLPSETQVASFIPAKNPSEFTGIGLADTCLKFLQVPYVWGGKTQWGLDCSGLIQLAVNLQGYSFPRDAWQQAEIGEEISFDQQHPQFEPGDLLFFREAGKRIHHVAISLGGDLFVHASEWVRIQSLSTAHSNFAEARLKTLCLAKKIRPAGLQTLSDSIQSFLKDQNI
jgi:cell wall-associated NlpC family hydrolase